MEAVASSFDLSLSTIMAGIIFGILGFWMFKEGKRRTNFSVLTIGIALMAYPYFVEGAAANWGVGIALCGLAYFLW